MSGPSRRRPPADRRLGHCLPPPHKSPTRSDSERSRALVGFDEEKCRNVLVRYCAYIPRNYQYRDGIRLVFLVLRDHLGDEHLGRAGGVLYELIEVDCHYSDDPGAAFQRWRHHHLNRHIDLELPHVPHLTTITSPIIPTGTLVQWRRDHPDRYSTRLSDHPANDARDASHPGSVRNRKSWMIDYTMFVSSRNGGTRPFRRIEAREFHETHWNQDLGRGRLVGVKSIDLQDPPSNSEADNSSAVRRDSYLPTRPMPSSLRPQSDLRRLMGKIYPGVKPSKNAGNPPWIGDLPGFSAAASLRNLLDSKSSPLVSEWEIPNAIFARKFGLFTDTNALPTSIKELPVAEDKAVDLAIESPMRELLYSWRFQGPFTPQLWFDSGLDYRWRRK